MIIYTSIVGEQPYPSYLSSAIRLFKSIHVLSQDTSIDYFIFCPEKYDFSKLSFPDNIKIVYLPDKELQFIPKRIIRLWVYRYTIVPLFLYKMGVESVLHLDGDMLCINKPNFNEIYSNISAGKICATLENIIPQKNLVGMISKRNRPWSVTNPKIFINGGFLAYNPIKQTNFFSSWLKKVKNDKSVIDKLTNDQDYLNFFYHQTPDLFTILGIKWNDRTYYYNPKLGIPANKRGNSFYINSSATTYLPKSYILHRPEVYPYILSLPKA